MMVLLSISLAWVDLLLLAHKTEFPFDALLKPTTGPKGQFQFSKSSLLISSLTNCLLALRISNKS